VNRGAWLSLRNTPYEDREEEFYWLWIIATATYGVGDIVSTIALVYFHPQVGEANPLVRWAIAEFNLGGLVGLKLGVFLTFIAINVTMARRGADPLLYYAPPAMLAVIGAYLTVWNIVVMAGVK
jgi:hypothetical protein